MSIVIINSNTDVAFMAGPMGAAGFDLKGNNFKPLIAEMRDKTLSTVYLVGITPEELNARCLPLYTELRMGLATHGCFEQLELKR